MKLIKKICFSSIMRDLDTKVKDKKVISENLNVNVDMNSELCEGCIYGKAHRLPFGYRRRVSQSGKLIHIYVCGTFQSSVSGLGYFVLFTEQIHIFRTIIASTVRLVVKIRQKRCLMYSIYNRCELESWIYICQSILFVQNNSRGNACLH